MNRMKLFLSLGVSAIGLSLAGCQGSSQSDDKMSSPPSSVNSVKAIAPTPSTTPTPPASPATELANPVTVTIYKADSQCVNFLPEEVEVSGDRAMQAAVGEVLKTYSNPDFDLSGYRVEMKDGVATVDLRIPANSPRTITSLSACEQFALFGSLRETLTKNPDWQVQSVRFTERGEEIAL